MTVLRARTAYQLLEKELDPHHFISTRQQPKDQSTTHFVAVTPHTTRKHRMSSTPATSPETHRTKPKPTEPKAKPGLPPTKKPRTTPFPVKVSFAVMQDRALKASGDGQQKQGVPSKSSPLDITLVSDDSDDEEEQDPGNY